MTNESLNKIAEKVDWDTDDGYLDHGPIQELLVEVYRLRSELADARGRELDARIVHLEAELASARALAAMNVDARSSEMERANEAMARVHELEVRDDQVQLALHNAEERERELEAELAKEREISIGRLKVLEEQADERRAEWLRAQRAEAEKAEAARPGINEEAVKALACRWCGALD